MEETTGLMTLDSIHSRVYFIRGQQVMLDYDLAEIYGYEVKRLNEQVKLLKQIVKEHFFLVNWELAHDVHIHLLNGGHTNVKIDERFNGGTFID